MVRALDNRSGVRKAALDWPQCYCASFRSDLNGFEKLLMPDAQTVDEVQNRLAECSACPSRGLLHGQAECRSTAAKEMSHFAVSTWIFNSDLDHFCDLPSSRCCFPYQLAKQKRPSKADAQLRRLTTLEKIVRELAGALPDATMGNVISGICNAIANCCESIVTGCTGCIRGIIEGLRNCIVGIFTCGRGGRTTTSTVL